MAALVASVLTPRRVLARAVAMVLVAGVVGSMVRIARPPTDHPTRADAIVVFYGGGDLRLHRALDLVHAGVAPTIVISNGLSADWAMGRRVCRQRHRFTVVCVRPTEFDTRGEARLFAELAQQRGWTSIVGVTSREHVLRASTLTRRCYHDRVQFVASGSIGSLAESVVHEWLGNLVATTVRRGC